uniref:Uncharacterized protein n=1 Tax=Pararge aegeria TaxID=116150 RepID=S4NZA0_9NEOP
MSFCTAFNTNVTTSKMHQIDLTRMPSLLKMKHKLSALGVCFHVNKLHIGVKVNLSFFTDYQTSRIGQRHTNLADLRNPLSCSQLET